ncbi:hypothetical protein FDP41_007370 [Naegleria fowleri]|uniref:Uncharacterized protein n=1 Tax=Naegleria fowleri TaxID=5763 RepID=A0A6A5C172_NAEFO|nr:uncharacterized protein FDP41_007370 [Naegleria fowleri]KAF0984193.1 hypothetical protein FDP41_007370 [Naegleria fowleri]
MQFKQELQIFKVFNKFVPKLKGKWPIIILLLNIFLPGVGTLVAGCVTSKKKKVKFCIIFGLLQMLLSVVLIGWLWSIFWGVFIYKRSTGLGKFVPDVNV